MLVSNETPTMLAHLALVNHRLNEGDRRTELRPPVQLLPLQPMLVVSLDELESGQKTRRIGFDDDEYENRYEVVGSRYRLLAEAQQIHNHEATVEHTVHLVFRCPVCAQLGDLFLR